MKDVQKVNNMSTDPIRNVLAGSLTKVIEDRKVELKMGKLIPLITDVDGLDVTSSEVVFNRGYFSGKAQLTDTRPNTVPTIVLDSKRVSVPMKWISFGIEVTRQDRDLYAKGKTKFENKSLGAMKVIAEGEESFLKKGLDGVSTEEGVNIVPSSAKWSTLTGPQILEEIRVGWSAHTMDGKFEAESLWLDKLLHDELQKPFSSTEPKSVLEVLKGRDWFKKIVSIAKYGTATIVEDNPNCFGYILNLPAELTEKYKEGTTEVHMLEEHLSSFILLQPESITKIEGAL